MILYHGSYLPIPLPDVRHSRSNVDFGKGFYTTPLLEQAEKWSKKFIPSEHKAVISRYQFDEKALQVCKVLRFDSYSESWLDFIMQCRRGNDHSHFEIVMGGVANDKVFNTIELFFQGLIEKKEAIKRLRYEKPNYQVVFRSQAVLERYLQYEGCEYYEG